MGRFTTAAKHHISIAEIYESDLVDFEKTVLHYQTAADYYSGEESKASANRCLLKVAQYSALNGDFLKVRVALKWSILFLNIFYFFSLLKYTSELHIPALNHRCWNIPLKSTFFALLYAICVLTRLTAPFQSKSTKMLFLVLPSLVSANLCPHWYRRLRNATRMALQLLSKTMIPFHHWTAGSVISSFESNRASRVKTTWSDLFN